MTTLKLQLIVDIDWTPEDLYGPEGDLVEIESNLRWAMEYLENHGLLSQGFNASGIVQDVSLKKIKED